MTQSEIKNKLKVMTKTKLFKIKEDTNTEISKRLVDEEILRKLREGYLIGTIFSQNNNPIEYNFLKKLCPYYPKEKPKKIPINPEKFIIVKNDRGIGNKIVILENNNEINFSAMDCIKNFYKCFNKKTDQNKKINIGFREEIKDKKIKFKKDAIYKNKGILTCKHCTKITNIDNFDADHHPKTFEEIKNEFLKIKNLYLLDVKLSDDGKIFDRTLAYDWKNYQDERVEYVISCATCNRGNRGRN